MRIYNNSIQMTGKRDDLRWQMDMLTNEERRFCSNTGRKVDLARGHFSSSAKSPRNQDNKNRESSRRSMSIETTTSNTLISCDGLGGYDWSDQAEEGPTNYALMAYSSSSSNSEEISCPPKTYLSHHFGLEEFTSEPVVIKLVVENSKAKASEAKPKAVRKNNGALIIED
ncbi:hypothetical protein Tco_1419327 [Tanacetum coccineum]